MEKTRFRGIFYKLNSQKKKVFIAVFRIDGKLYRKVIGKEPQYNLVTANKARQDMIDKHKIIVTTYKESNFLTMYLDYVDQIAPIRSTEYVSSATYGIKKWCKPIANKKPSEVTTDDCQKIINTMLKSVKPKTAKVLKDYLIVFYKFIAKRGYEGSNPMTNIELPKFDNTRELSLTLEEIREIVKKIVEYPDSEIRLIFVFLLHGRRRGEVQKLEWQNIDIESMSYTVLPENNKIRRRMEYPISNMLLEALNIYGIKKSGLVFTRATEGRIYWALKLLKEQANIIDKDFRLHDFRHVVGSVAVNNGLSLEQIGKALGHLSTQTTKRYSNVRLASSAIVVDSVLDSIT